MKKRNVRKQRQELGMSQTQLAQLAHVSQRLISKIECGEPVTMPYRLVVFSALDSEIARQQKKAADEISA